MKLTVCSGCDFHNHHCECVLGYDTTIRPCKPFATWTSNNCQLESIKIKGEEPWSPEVVESL